MVTENSVSSIKKMKEKKEEFESRNQKPKQIHHHKFEYVFIISHINTILKIIIYKLKYEILLIS